MRSDITRGPPWGLPMRVGNQGGAYDERPMASRGLATTRNAIHSGQHTAVSKDPRGRQTTSAVQDLADERGLGWGLGTNPDRALQDLDHVVEAPLVVQVDGQEGLALGHRIAHL